MANTHSFSPLPKPSGEGQLWLTSSADIFAFQFFPHLTATSQGRAHLCLGIDLPHGHDVPVQSPTGLLLDLPPCLWRFLLSALIYRSSESLFTNDNVGLDSLALAAHDPLRVVLHEGGSVNKDVFLRVEAIDEAISFLDVEPVDTTRHPLRERRLLLGVFLGHFVRERLHKRDKSKLCNGLTSKKRFIEAAHNTEVIIYCPSTM